MVFNPFSFITGNARVPGSVGELEDKLFENAQKLEEQLRSGEVDSDQNRAERADRERVTRENQDRIKRIKDAQLKLSEAKQRRADAEKSQLPEAMLWSLSARVDAAQKEFELAAAEPRSIPEAKDGTVRPEPQQRLDQLRDLRAKAKNLSETIARGGGDEQMKALLNAYEGKIADLQQASPGQAARPTALPPGTPAARLEAQVQKLMENIALARQRNMSDLQIESMERQLDGLRNGLRLAIEKLPGSINKPNEQPKAKSQLQAVEDAIRELQTQIAEMAKNPALALRVDSREIQLAALVQEAKRLREKGETGEDAAPVNTVNAHEEISKLEMALDELGIGFELMNDPRKVEEATKLRNRLSQLKKALPPDASVRVEPNGYGAETLETTAQAQSAQIGNSARVITDPKVKAMLARYFGDTQEFTGAVRDNSQPKAQINHQQMTQELTEDFAAQFLTFLPGDTNLPPDLKEKGDKLKQSVSNELVNALNDPNNKDAQSVFEQAKKSLTKNFLKSPEHDGAYAVLRDLRSLMLRSRAEGTIGAEQYEKYEQLASNPAFMSEVMTKIEARTRTGSNSMREEVVTDLFQSALQHADKQLAKERKRAGGSTLDRLAGLTQLGQQIGSSPRK